MTVKNLRSIRPIFRSRTCDLCGKSWRWKRGVAWTRPEDGAEHCLCPRCKPPGYIDTPSKVGRWVEAIKKSRPPDMFNCRCYTIPPIGQRGGITTEEAVASITNFHAYRKARRESMVKAADAFAESSDKITDAICGSSEQFGHWKKHPKTEDDISDTWTSGDYILRCQLEYPRDMGGGANWILERLDRKPVEIDGNKGLLLAFWEGSTLIPPLEKASRILHSMKGAQP